MMSGHIKSPHTGNSNQIKEATKKREKQGWTEWLSMFLGADGQSLRQLVKPTIHFIYVGACKPHEYPCPERHKTFVFRTVPHLSMMRSDTVVTGYYMSSFLILFTELGIVFSNIQNLEVLIHRAVSLP